MEQDNLQTSDHNREAEDASFEDSIDESSSEVLQLTDEMAWVCVWVCGSVWVGVCWSVYVCYSVWECVIVCWSVLDCVGVCWSLGIYMLECVIMGGYESVGVGVCVICGFVYRCVYRGVGVGVSVSVGVGM